MSVSVPGKPGRSGSLTRRLGAISLLAAGFVIVGIASPGMAFAQDTASAIPPASTLAHAYRLTNADGDRVCDLSLGTTKHGAAKADQPLLDVKFDRTACAGLIAFSEGIDAWSPGPGNSILLYDPAGTLVAEFTEGVGGTWEALREGEGVFFLIDPRLADTVAPVRPADMFGDWIITGAQDNILCRLKLTEQNTGDTSFAVTPATDCAPGLSASQWTLDGGDLVLSSSTGVVRFARQEDGEWSRVPPSSKSPLSLTRP